MQRGKAVKPLAPKARLFCDRHFSRLRDCKQRGQNTWFPAPPSPSSLTCGPQPCALLAGCQSTGTQEPTKRAFPAAMASPESPGPRRAAMFIPPQTRSREPRSWPAAQAGPAPDALTVRPTPTPPSRTGPRDRDCLQVKHKDKQIHPTETIQAFSQLICLWFRDKTMTIESKDDLGQPWYSIEPDPGGQRLEERPGALSGQQASVA